MQPCALQLRLSVFTVSPDPLPVTLGGWLWVQARATWCAISAWTS